jgi:hypothetical protein
MFVNLQPMPAPGLLQSREQRGTAPPNHQRRYSGWLVETVHQGEGFIAHV